MKPHAVPKPCTLCGEPVLARPGQLSRNTHNGCRIRQGMKRKPVRPPTPAYKLTRPVSRHGVTRPNVDIAKGNHRDRGLLDLAHELHDCTNCNRHVAEGLEPAHENSIEAGKGFGIKSQDHRHAALCHACHAWLDQGGKRSPCGQWSVEQKPFMWDRAHKRTFDEYWKRGWIRVAA